MNEQQIATAYQTGTEECLAQAIDNLGAGVVASARGATLTTSQGRTIVDLASGGFGYSHPYVVERVAAQIRAMPLSTRVFFSRPLAALIERIARLTPGDLAVSFFGASGAEAVEGALKLAKCYHRRRRRFVAAIGSYHGGSTGALAVCGVHRLRLPLTSHPLETAFVPYGDALALERVVDDDTIAIILEPVAAGSEVRVPPAGYLQAVRRRATATGALLIADEVTTGLGRTGARFGVDHDRVVPDIMCLGSSLGGGVLPIGCYVARARINNQVYDKQDPLLHANTTGGNPAACTAALATLDVVEQENLGRRAERAGAEINQAIGGLRRRYDDAILDLGGKGLLIGFRVRSAALAREIQRRALAAGALVRLDGLARGEPWIGLRPPLLVSDAELERGLEALRTAIGAAVAPRASALVEAAS
jgi:putrescine aminotransferase